MNTNTTSAVVAQPLGENCDKKCTYKELFALFDELDIVYKNYEHEQVFTVEEAEKCVHDIPGAHTKNLFVRDKKKTGIWLITLGHDELVDLKELGRQLGAKGNLTFCKAEQLWELLGVLPGSVTPLGAINDVNNDVTVVLDAVLMEADLVNPHPLQNDMTVGLAPDDLVRFLRHVGHEPLILDVAKR